MSHTKKTKEHKANQQWTEKMLMLRECKIKCVS